MLEAASLSMESTERGASEPEDPIPERIARIEVAVDPRLTPSPEPTLALEHPNSQIALASPPIPVPLVTAPLATAEKQFVLLSIDVETTGLSPGRGDRIVSVSLVEAFPDGLGVRFERMVNPGRPIPADVTRVHGIRDEDVRDKPTFAQIADELSAFVGDRAIIGYNLGFDLRFLKAEFNRAAVSLPPGLLLPGFDIMRLVERLQGGKRMKLHSACATYGVDLSALRAHSATDDAVATAKLLPEVARQTNDALFWQALAASKVSLDTLREEGRYYDDDDLEAAWWLFVERRYDEAISRARAAIARDEAKGGPIMESRAYELASIILRRVRRHEKELEVLHSFLCRALGHEPTREEVRILSLDPLDAEYQQRRDRGTLIPALSTPKVTIGRRPAPSVGDLAGRLLGLLKKVEKVPETHEERLARCRTAVPYDGVLQELAVCLRKEFVARQPSDPKEAAKILRELHATAQRYAFLHGSYPTGRDDPEWEKDARDCLWGNVAAELATSADLAEVVLDYREVGYEGLALLNKTDVVRLVRAIGEPNEHINVRVRHINVWNRLRKALRAKKAGG